MSSLSNRRQIIVKAPDSVLTAKAQVALAQAAASSANGYTAQASAAAEASIAAAQGRFYPDYATGNAATIAGQGFIVVSGGAYLFHWHGNATPAARLATVNVATGEMVVTRSSHGDVAEFKSGGAGGQTLYVYVDDTTVGLFNTAGAGAGRDGVRIGGSSVAFDVDAAEALQFDANGHWLPGFDNSRNIGSGSKRIKDIYLVNSPTVTSDAEDKDWLGCGFTDDELRAAKRIAAEIGSYRWLASIGEHGDLARIHFGVRAQAVWAIMADEGLIDPVTEGQAPSSRYAFLCHNKWAATEAVPELRDGSGETIRAAVPAQPAGHRFGIRPDQLTMFLIAALEARLAALEAAL